MTSADTANHSNSSSLTSLIHEAGPRVLAAIKKASAATGVSFSYMLQKASAESGLNAKAKSSTSSATGLYQFIDKTWLTMVKKYGDKCGMGSYAACIDSNGNVSDKATKQAILNLRKDPDANAMMAAEYTAENKTYMQQQLGSGTQIGATELGIAHFLGAGGATAFMKAYQDNPLQQASDIFPKAANVNRNVFYDSKTGQARTVAGVYDYFAKKFGGPDNTSGLSATVVGSTNVAVPARQAAMQAAIDQTGIEQTTIQAMSNGTDADSAPSAAASADNPDTAIHWFTPRYAVPAMADTGSAAVTPSIADPAQVMLMAQRIKENYRSQHAHAHHVYTAAG